MAYLELKSGKKRAISAEQGLFLWKALRDPAGLDDKQLAKIATIKKIYLNWHNAPDDYIAENLGYIIPIALNDWMFSRQGKPSRPGNDASWKFAKRWGLWLDGSPTARVSNPAVFAQATLAGGLEVNDR